MLPSVSSWSPSPLASLPEHAIHSACLPPPPHGLAVPPRHFPASTALPQSWGPLLGPAGAVNTHVLPSVSPWSQFTAFSSPPYALPSKGALLHPHVFDFFQMYFPASPAPPELSGSDSRGRFLARFRPTWPPSFPRSFSTSHNSINFAPPGPIRVSMAISWSLPSSSCLHHSPIVFWRASSASHMFLGPTFLHNFLPKSCLHEISAVLPSFLFSFSITLWVPAPPSRGLNFEGKGT